VPAGTPSGCAGAVAAAVAPPETADDPLPEEPPPQPATAKVAATANALSGLKDLISHFYTGSRRIMARARDVRHAAAAQLGLVVIATRTLCVG